MLKHLWSSVLTGLVIMIGSRVPAHAQAGPYDHAKVLALAGDIEGVKLGMPLAEARQRLTGAGYVTPPRPSGGVSARGRAIAPPCSPQKPPVEEERYHYPNVPRDYRELVLQYSCVTQRVVLLSLSLLESAKHQSGAPPLTAEDSPMFGTARVIYEQLCGPYVSAKAPQTHVRELSGPPALNASLRCGITQNAAFAAMSKLVDGVSYVTSVNVGLLGPTMFSYTRHLTGLPK